MEIKESFENIWKVISQNKKYRKSDKKRYYNFFLEGYGCALIDLEERRK